MEKKGGKFSKSKVEGELQRFLKSSGAEKVCIDMLHKDDVKNYVMQIENAHKKATKSKLLFR